MKAHYRVMSTIVIFCLVAITVLATDGPSVEGHDLSQISTAPPATGEDKLASPDKATSSRQSLGAYSADGGSPGQVIGRTWRDRQAWISPGRMVDWRGTPSIHFGWLGQACDGPYASCERSYHYNMYDPTTDSIRSTWLPNENGLWLPSSPLVTAGSYTQLDVDRSGHAIVTGHTWDAQAPVISLVNTFWDTSAAGEWGNFDNAMIDNSISQNVNNSVNYPKIAYQEFDGQSIVHIIALEINDYLTYWRKVGDGPAGVWTTQILTDSLGGNIWFDLSASRIDGQVAAIWLQVLDPIFPTNGKGVRIKISDDAGVSWPTDAAHYKNLMESHVPTATPYPAWLETSCTFDSDGYLHVLYNAAINSTTINPCRIYHWTNRVAGSVAGGTLSIVSHIDIDFGVVCGRGWVNVQSAAKPVISECDGRLFAIWQQFGDTDAGDSTDCAADIGFAGSYNSDIFLAAAADLDGSAWSERINITNSKTPGCDGTPGNECDHDNYATMARFGMNTASFGPTYWSQVQDAYSVRDYIDPSYPDDGYYLDVIYVNDLQAGLSDYVSEGMATYNPMKWFRIPCGSPVVISNDFDSDGVPNSSDNCPHDANPGQEDTDVDGVGDLCDNCPELANPDQLDANHNDVGDACESCCGLYASGNTGNTNCSDDGKRNLADITLLIDNVYISKVPLCCPENGNVDGDIENKTNLADITSLIDHVYINKNETAPCQ